MPSESLAHEVVCWTSPEKAGLAKDVLSWMGDAVSIVAFGGPPHRLTAEAAKALNVPCFDDLRQTLIDTPPRYLLLADCDSVPEDAFATAHDASIRLITLEPIAATLADLSSIRPRTKSPQAALDLIPAFDQSLGMVNLGEIDEHLGGRRLVKAVSLGSIDHQDLFTRLYDLWSIALHFVGPPESISASLSGPAPADHNIPDNPRRLTGHIAVHARGLSGSAILLHAGAPGSGKLASHAAGRSVVADEATRVGNESSEISDQKSPVLIPEEKHLQIFGDRGRLTLTEHAFDLSSNFDDFQDQAVFDGDPPESFAAACAAQWKQRLTHPTHHAGSFTANPAEHEDLTLACCLACRLSARTGQPENPYTVAQMAR